MTTKRSKKKVAEKAAHSLVKKKKKSVPVKQEEISEHNKARLDAYLKRKEISNPYKAIEIKEGEDELSTEETVIFWEVTLSEAAGTTDLDLAKRFIAQAASTSRVSPDDYVGVMNEIITVMHGIAPQDVIEGMLAAQMVATHNLALEMTRRASLEDQTVDGINTNVNRATKLTRTFIAQIDALNKHRGKGQQKVTVEHVHVNEGGQAIVGNINQGGGGNG